MNNDHNKVVNPKKKLLKDSQKIRKYFVIFQIVDERIFEKISKVKIAKEGRLHF